MLIKKDSRREPFQRAKVLAGLKKACDKRPISIATLGAVADRVEKRIQERGEAEVQARVVGEEVMAELYQLEQLAYARFASLYREVKDVAQLMDEGKVLIRERGPG